MISKWLLLTLLLLAACEQTIPPEQGTRLANRGIISAAYSNDGELVFIGSFNDGGSLWRTKDMERLYNWNHGADEPSAIRSAVFSEDGDFVATSIDKEIALWNTSTGQSIRFWQSPSRITSLDLAKHYVLIGQSNNNALVFDTIRGGVVGNLHHEDVVSSVALDSNAKFAMTGSHDGTARYWSLDNGSELYTWQHKTPVEFVLISPDASYALSAAYQGPVSLWDTNTGELIHELYKKNPSIQSAEFNLEKQQLLIGTSREKAILWDLKTGEKINTWQIPNDGPWHGAAVIALCFVEGSSEGKATYQVIASDGVSYELF